jgi:hypothetical protein
VHTCRERNVKNIEQNQSYKALFHQSRASFSSFYFLSDFGYDVKNEGDQNSPTSRISMTLQLLMKVPATPIFGIILWHLRCLAGETEIKAVEGAELGEWSQVHVEEIV